MISKRPFPPNLPKHMGRKVEKWQRDRALGEALDAGQIDLQALRPAGFETAGAADAHKRGRHPNQYSPPRSEPYQQLAKDQLIGDGNYRPAYQIQEARQRFLDLYAERGTFVECCRIAGLSYNSVQHAIERDPDFAERFKEAEQRVLEKLEQEAMRRAVEGTVVRSRKFWHGELVGEDIKTEYSDNLLMMLLRARAPERYRENSLITINQVIKAVEGFNPAEVLGTPVIDQ